MYVPKKHRPDTFENVFEFIQKYSFGILISQIENNLQAVHIPFLIKKSGEQIILTGHVAKANPLTNAIVDQQDVMLIFSEPHSYVSSSWYDHVNVPTWNYIAVHVYGKIQVMEGDELKEELKKMVDLYEEGRPNRFHLEDMPEDMLQAHIKGITAFKVTSTKIEANYKLSQNRNDKNYTEVIRQLNTSSNPLDQEIADQMKQIRPQIKNNKAEL